MNFTVEEQSASLGSGPVRQRMQSAACDIPKGSLAQFPLQLIVGDSRAALEAVLGSQMAESKSARRGAVWSRLWKSIHDDLGCSAAEAQSKNLDSSDGG
jgi:hypothetical protein